MAFLNPIKATIEDLAIGAVRVGRELGEQIAAMRDAPVGDLPRSSLTAALQRLEIGEVTEDRDLVVLDALESGLAERMSLEIVGAKVEPRVVGHDEDGEICVAVEVPVYSDRGQEAQSAYEHLGRFLELRQQLLDHTRAERLAMRLLH